MSALLLKAGGQPLGGGVQESEILRVSPALMLMMSRGRYGNVPSNKWYSTRSTGAQLTRLTNGITLRRRLRVNNDIIWRARLNIEKNALLAGLTVGRRLHWLKSAEWLVTQWRKLIDRLDRQGASMWRNNILQSQAVWSILRGCQRHYIDEADGLALAKFGVVHASLLRNSLFVDSIGIELTGFSFICTYRDAAAAAILISGVKRCE